MFVSGMALVMIKKVVINFLEGKITPEYTSLDILIMTIPLLELTFSFRIGI